MNSSDDRTTMFANSSNLANVYTNMTASYECEEPYPNQKEILSSVSWWLDGFVQIIIGCLGFAGNAIAIPVLSSRKLSSIFNRILVFLAGHINQYHIYLQGHFLFQLNSVAIVASIITTVVLALERYLAVSKPIEYHNATLGINPWRRVMNYIIPVVVFSIIFNIPKFFEIKIQEYPDNPEGTNCCSMNEEDEAIIQNISTTPSSILNNATQSMLLSNSTPDTLGIMNNETTESSCVECTYSLYLFPTDLRMNDYYVFYYNNIAKLVVTGLIPFMALCFFNYKIYLALRRRRDIMGPAATAAHQQQLNEDHRQALVLFSIVIIFLVTNSPRILINIDEVFNINKYKEDLDHGCDLPMWILLGGQISQVLMITNSSINFFIYCFMSSIFRDVVWEILSSITGRCCALPIFHHIVTFLQSPVDFWRTRGGHQNSRRGQGMARINRPNANPNLVNNRCHSPVDNSYMTNDVGPHSTTMATIITNGDGEIVTNELIQLTEAKQWSNGNKALVQDIANQKDQKISEGNEPNSSQMTVTSNKCGEHKTLTVPNDTTQVSGNAKNKNINGSLV